MNTASSRPASHVLGVFRYHARRAWLLHGYMIAMLVLLPVWPQAALAEDDPPPAETWNEPVAQSCLLAHLTCTTGSSYTDTDSSKQLDVSLERHSWIVSTSDLGNTSISDYNVAPVSGEHVYFSITSPNGGGVASSFASDAWTDTAGKCSASIPIDDAPNVVAQAAVSTINGESVTSSFTFTKEVPVEEWSFSHAEALLHASITADGSVELTSGEQRTVTVTATYETWDVYTSSLGNTETRNHYSSPAAGASVYWALYSADGAIWSPSGEQLESDGTGTIEFIMGSSDATVQADLGYLSTMTTTATKSFTPATVTETWTMDRTEGSISTSLHVADGSSGLSSGDSRTVDATVTLTTWEIWNSNLGNSETRNYASGPAIGTPVVFHVATGDGVWGAASGGGHITTISTDGDGRSSAQFYMGGSDSNVTVSASYNSSESSAGLTFTLPSGPTDPIWSKLGDYHDLIVNVSASATTAATVPVNATVSYRTWEVWGNDQNSNTEIRNDTTSAAINAPVTVLVASGNGSVSSSTTSTDTSGGYGATYTAGSQASVVTVSASFTSAKGTVSGSGSITISNLDTDGDGYSDANETSVESDPNDAASTPENVNEAEYDFFTYEGSYTMHVWWTETYNPFSFGGGSFSFSAQGVSLSLNFGGINWERDNSNAEPNWEIHGNDTPSLVAVPPGGGEWVPDMGHQITGQQLSMDSTNTFSSLSTFRVRDLTYQVNWKRVYRVRRP
jgi:hypothetical protein